MMKTDYQEICITNQNMLRITYADGTVTELDFNACYRGYYPACRFTAAASGGRQLYAAGTDAEGVPHLFVSGTGSVWSPVSIQSHTTPVPLCEYGDIVRILYDSAGQTPYLVTRAGYLVILPDCPKCVRARKVSDVPVADARLIYESSADARKSAAAAASDAAEKSAVSVPDGRDADAGAAEKRQAVCIGRACGILLTDITDTRREIPLRAADAFRIAWPTAKPFLGSGGMLLDLRDPAEAAEHPLQGAFVIPPEGIGVLLDHLPKERYLFFVCETGAKAEDAVTEARSRGFSHAYTLGGTGDLILGSGGVFPIA